MYNYEKQVYSEPIYTNCFTINNLKEPYLFLNKYNYL